MNKTLSKIASGTASAALALSLVACKPDPKIEASAPYMHAVRFAVARSCGGDLTTAAKIDIDDIAERSVPLAKAVSEATVAIADRFSYQYHYDAYECSTLTIPRLVRNKLEGLNDEEIFKLGRSMPNIATILTETLSVTRNPTEIDLAISRAIDLGAKDPNRLGVIAGPDLYIQVHKQGALQLKALGVGIRK